MTVETVKMVILRDLHTEFIRCTLRVGGDAERAAELLLIVNAEYHVGVAYVYRQKH